MINILLKLTNLISSFSYNKYNVSSNIYSFNKASNI